MNNQRRGINNAIEHLKNPDTHVRLAAISTLEGVHDPAIIEPLIAVIETDSDGCARKNAMEVLSGTGDPRAVAPLMAVLRKSGGYNCKIGSSLIGGPLRNVAADALKKLGTVSLDPLLVLLKDDDKDIQQLAVFALAGVKAPQSVDTLVAALSDPNPRMRRGAARALGLIMPGAMVAIAPLALALQHDSDSSARASSAYALGEILQVYAPSQSNDPRISDAITVMMTQSKDPDFAVREGIITALANLLPATKDISIRKTIAFTMMNERPENVAKNYYYRIYLKLGLTDSEDLLINSLDNFGNQYMAEDFLNSTNSRLGEAARKWARDHGYGITTQPGSGIRWGRG